LYPGTRGTKHAQLRKKTGTVYIDPKTRILWKLKKYKGGLSKTKLNNLTSLTAEQREKALKMLMKEGKVKEIVRVTGSKPQTTYKLVET